MYDKKVPLFIGYYSINLMPRYNTLDFHVYLVNARVMMVYILLDQVDISRVLISHNTFKILSGILTAMSRLVRIS